MRKSIHIALVTILATLAAGLSIVASPASAGATPLFNGNYDTGNLSQWGNCQTKFWNNPCASMPSSYSIQTVTSPLRQGSHAARFEVRDGDIPNFGGGERAEVSAGKTATGASEGTEGWYQWSSMVEPGLPVAGWGAVFAQFHSGSGSPPVALMSTASDKWGIKLKGGTVIWQTPMNHGNWQDFKMHFKWSSSSSKGYIELWHNGVQQTFTGGNSTTCKGKTRCYAATLDKGSSSYFKQGYYRDQAHTTTGVVYHDGYSAGTTEADLLPLQ